MIMMVGRRSDELAKWAAALFGMALPLSTSLDSILMALTVFLWLLGNNFRIKYAMIRNNPVAIAAFVVSVIYLVGLLYGHADKGALEDATLFLLIPIMITLFQEERIRRYAWRGFLASMLLTLGLSYLIFFNVIPNIFVTKIEPIRPGAVIIGSIAQNFFMAFTAFLLATKARFADKRFLRVLFGALSGLAAINVLFMVPNKTGQLILVVLIGYYLFAWMHWKGMVVAGLVIFIIAGLIYRMPASPVHIRLSEMIQEYGQWQPDRRVGLESATGLRMEFYHNSLKLTRENPFFGVGTGGFRSAYERQIGTSQMVTTDNPHNQYLLTGVELGLVGLAGLVSLFLIQWRMAARFPRGQERLLAYAMLLAITTGCMFNSFLADHAEGLLYVWTTALLYAGLPSARNVETAL